VLKEMNRQRLALAILVAGGALTVVVWLGAALLALRELS